MDFLVVNLVDDNECIQNVPRSPLKYRYSSLVDDNECNQNVPFF